jgi:chromosome partitioning protein
MDPQANLTMGLGVESDELEYSIYEVLLNPQYGTDFATVTIEKGLDIVPSTLALAGAELELAGKVGRETLLRKALRQSQDRYDFFLIDSPPSLGLFTLNALAAAKEVIVPLQTHAFAFKAMPQLEATIDLIRELNPGLKIGGIICTLVDRRTNLSKVVEEQIRSAYGDIVFQTIIPMNVKLAEAPAAKKAVVKYAPNSTGARAYEELAAEMEKRYGY